MNPPVKPGAIEAIRDVKRYYGWRSGMNKVQDAAVKFDEFVSASDFDQQALALDSARRELKEAREALEKAADMFRALNLVRHEEIMHAALSPTKAGTIGGGDAN